MNWTRCLLPFIMLGLLMPSIASAEPTHPEKIARQTVQQVLHDLDGRRDELKDNPEQLHQLIDKDLVPLIDLQRMSQLVLGRSWRKASSEQRQRFETAFKNMLIRSYGSALLHLKENVDIQYQPVRAPEDAERVTFRANIHAPNGKDTPVNLKLHLVDDEWRVYDGSIGDLSFVTNYRGQFNSAIKRDGLEDFIQKMEKRYNPSES